MPRSTPYPIILVACDRKGSCGTRHQTKGRERCSHGAERKGKERILQVGGSEYRANERHSHQIIPVDRIYEGLECEITPRAHVDFGQL